MASAVKSVHGVWLNNRAGSRHVAIVIAQEPAQTLSTSDLTASAPPTWLWSNELVREALRIPLGMIVDQVLLDRIRQGTFTQQDQLCRSRLFDRAHKPFAVRIEVWAPRW